MAVRYSPSIVFLLWALTLILGADSDAVNVVFLILASIAFLLSVQESMRRRNGQRPTL